MANRPPEAKHLRETFLCPTRTTPNITFADLRPSITIRQIGRTPMRLARQMDAGDFTESTKGLACDLSGFVLNVTTCCVDWTPLALSCWFAFSTLLNGLPTGKNNNNNQLANIAVTRLVSSLAHLTWPCLHCNE